EGARGVAGAPLAGVVRAATEGLVLPGRDDLKAFRVEVFAGRGIVRPDAEVSAVRIVIGAVVTVVAVRRLVRAEIGVRNVVGVLVGIETVAPHKPVGLEIVERPSAVAAWLRGVARCRDRRSGGRSRAEALAGRWATVRDP